MSEHYYSEKPSVKSDPRSWQTKINDKKYSFTTDRGVFSKDDIDFGSRLLIESFIQPDIPGDFLDVGCGYGPIGLSIASAFPSRKVFMVDINERAVNLAKTNAQQNSIENVEITQSDLFEKVNGEFSAVVTNPPIRAGKAVVFEIFEKAYQYLLSGGQLWVVIQKKQGALSAMSKIEDVFGNVNIVLKKKGYYIITGKK